MKMENNEYTPEQEEREDNVRMIRKRILESIMGLNDVMLDFNVKQTRMQEYQFRLTSVIKEAKDEGLVANGYSTEGAKKIIDDISKYGIEKVIA